MSDIFIVGHGSLSASGVTGAGQFDAWSEPRPEPKTITIGSRDCPVFALNKEAEALWAKAADELKEEEDRSLSLGLAAAKLAMTDVDWPREARTGIIVGSSRGASGLLEASTLRSNRGEKLSPSTSPKTTLGNFPTSIGRALGLSAVPLSVSMTCTGGIVAIANAAAWMRAGMLDAALVGGLEAPLTEFTLNQMLALRFYAKKGTHPCRPLARGQKRSSFCLGEGAAMFALESGLGTAKKSILAKISGLGFSTETEESAVAISSNAVAIHRAMTKALADAGDDRAVDAVIAHAPGTVKGDEAELKAINALFKSDMPAVLSTKFLTGHTFGASGALGLDYGLFLLRGGAPVPYPYESSINRPIPRRFARILVNTAGFGGVAASVIIDSVE